MLYFTRRDVTLINTPVDATISFGGGLDIVWNAQKLGSMKMPDVKLTGDVGATLNLDATFEVASTTVLTAFTKASQFKAPS